MTVVLALAPVTATRVGEQAAKTLVIVIVLLIGFRLTGKRELAQFNVYDLAMVMALSNAVQNAMTGGLGNLPIGLATSSTVVLGAWAVSWVLARRTTLETRVLGSPVLLVNNGHLLQGRLRQEHVSPDELEEACRTRGMSSHRDARLVVLEVDGSISVVPKREADRRPGTRAPAPPGPASPEPLRTRPPARAHHPAAAPVSSRGVPTGDPTARPTGQVRRVTGRQYRGRPPVGSHDERDDPVTIRPHRFRRAVLGPLVLALTAVAVVGAAGPAGAQTVPTPSAPTTTPSTASPSTASPSTASPSTTTPANLGNEAQLVSVAIELSRTSDRLDLVAAQAAAVQARLAAAQAAFADVDQRVTTTQTEINQIQSQLTARAAVAYEQHSDQGAVLRVQHVLDVAAGEQYTNAASGSDARQLDDLNTAQAQLVQERAQRDAERQAISDDEARLQATEADLNAVRARDQAFLNQVGGIPIMGDARLNATQLAAWFHSTGQVAHLANATAIEDLTQMYIQEGAAEHVAGDVAFAQAIIETGSFGHALDNNFSGIGACDSCTSEIAFPTPRDGVRAQIQLLKSYADPDSRADSLANPPEPALFGGSPTTAVAAYNSFSLKGSTPVWNLMGNGKWATDPDYATKVLEVYARMIAFAAQNH